MDNKLLIICGPTATGKTDLAIKFAKKFNGEIVSADSRQVYRGMDVGTGKDKPKFSIFNFSRQLRDPAAAGQFSIKNKKRIGYYLINGIKIWLYDIVEPSYQFNVADYKESADLVISDILRRGKLPILVGGTGLYIKAAVDGIETIGVPPDWELRKKLSNFPIIKLRIILKKLDPEKLAKMNNSDRNNPRRLVRAIEIALKLKSQILKIKTLAKNLKLDKLFIGLTASNENLYQKIDQRVDVRVRQGMEKEIKRLLKAGYSFENSALGTTIAYKEWKPYFHLTENPPGGEAGIKHLTILKEEIIKQWKFDEHAYARRQVTWFKKALRQAQGENKRINWFNITKDNYQNCIIDLINQWLFKKS